MPKIYLKDYTSPNFTIPHIDLKFELEEENTIVTSTLFVKKQNNEETNLVLNTGNFELISIELNQNLLTDSNYILENNQLTLLQTPNEDFQLKIITKINPKNNTALSGLYATDGILTTQCESEGFRDITCYLDRPDVLATFTTEIHADKTKFPILLSNGNEISTGPHPTDPTKHVAIYHDPIPKPSYLFAMVAGQFFLHEDSFTTLSGKEVALKIFVPHEDWNKTMHPMQALKEAMRFDEEYYDREYDLDIYNIVGVSQFNAGAMENKGLNIFNKSSLLVHPESATDSDFERVSATVGHEYFHNWRGNRVTVENWFQLCLKEGFATITEQEFSQVLSQSMVSRIGDIIDLQSRQFKEDAGPLAHPVMPSEYEQPENLYTTTIYLKGAELLNMLQTLLGKEVFKKGCSIYFSAYDGKAANIEEFLAAMEKASNKDLSQFLLWYQQAGTPLLEFEDHYDPDTLTYRLTVKQTCLPTPGQPDKKPLLVPIALGLLDQQGQEITLHLNDETGSRGTTAILELSESEETFTFVNVPEKPVPSLLRNFSAPVKIIKSPVSENDLKFLLKHDQDPINRWLSSCTLAQQMIIRLINALKNNNDAIVDQDLIECYRAILLDKSIEPRLKGELLSFPPIESLIELVQPADPDLIYAARELFINTFIDSCYPELLSTYIDLTNLNTIDNYSPEAAGVRYLKNLCLSLLMQSNSPESLSYCSEQLNNSNNMTDTVGALTPLAMYYREDRVRLRQEALDNFREEWKDDGLAIQQLFRIYAVSNAPDIVDQIKELTQSPLFNKENPDHIVSLLRRFYLLNPKCFHESSGKAYQFFGDLIIELDKINPSSASYLVPAFANWKELEPKRQEKMLEQLYRLYDLPDLSEGVRELVNKSVQDALEQRKVPTMVNPYRMFQADEDDGELLEDKWGILRALDL